MEKGEESIEEREKSDKKRSKKELSIDCVKEEA